MRRLASRWRLDSGPPTGQKPLDADVAEPDADDTHDAREHGGRGDRELQQREDRAADRAGHRRLVARVARARALVAIGGTRPS